MKNSNCPEIAEFIKWVHQNCTDRLLFMVHIIEPCEYFSKRLISWTFNKHYFNNNLEDYFKYVKSSDFGSCNTKELYNTWYKIQNDPKLRDISFDEYFNDTFIPVNFLEFLVLNEYWLCRTTNNNGSGLIEEFWMKGCSKPKGKYNLEELYEIFLNNK